MVFSSFEFILWFLPFFLLTYYSIMRYEKYGMGLLMLLLVTGVIDRPLGAMRDWLLTWLNSLGAWGYTLPNAIF